MARGVYLRTAEFNTAFYGNFPDGSPAFGDQHDSHATPRKSPNLPEDQSPLDARTVSTSQASRKQLLAMSNDTAGGGRGAN